MNFKKSIIAFFVLLGVGGLVYFIPDSGIVPAATVNYHTISQDDLKKMSNATLTYYENALKTYGGNKEELKKEENKKEIRRATLEQLIEDQLIQAELEKRLGDDLNSVVENKISALKQNANFKQEVETLYGINFNEFIQLFLIPQAKRETLEGRLYIEESNLQTWLDSAKKDAKIIMFTNEFSWNNGHVELAK